MAKMLLYSRCSYFNPRSREGSDSLGVLPAGTSVRFQSTLPRGERHKLNDKDSVII